MKFKIHGIGGKWCCMASGDDSVTVTTDKEIARLGGIAGIVAAYAKLGMEVEAKCTADPTEVNFCSARFMQVGETFILVPKTGKLLGKLCWDTVNRNPKNQIAWLRGIAATLLHYGQADPILHALGDRLHSLCGEGKVIKERYNEFTHRHGKVPKIAEADYLSYYDKHYDLSASDVAHIIRRLQNAELREFCDDPLVVAMVAHDY